MATTDVDRVLIDTNVLVYARRPTAPEHVAVRTALARVEASDCAVWVSPQVLREYLAVVTRPRRRPAVLNAIESRSRQCR
jgi:predicted nucleic acid-binding protein